MNSPRGQLNIILKHAQFILSIILPMKISHIIGDPETVEELVKTAATLTKCIEELCKSITGDVMNNCRESMMFSIFLFIDCIMDNEKQTIRHSTRPRFMPDWYGMERSDLQRRGV